MMSEVQSFTYQITAGVPNLLTCYPSYLLPCRRSRNTWPAGWRWRLRRGWKKGSEKITWLDRPGLPGIDGEPINVTCAWLSYIRVNISADLMNNYWNYVKDNSLISIARSKNYIHLRRFHTILIFKIYLTLYIDFNIILLYVTHTYSFWIFY